MSGKTETPIVCWDSCIFLAWFGREKNKPLADIACALREVKSENVVCYVSPITRIEILNRTANSTARQKLKEWMTRPNVQSPNVDERVIEYAAEIRQRSVAWAGSADGRAILQTPDCLIAGMAVLYKTSHIFTFDSGLQAYSAHEVLFGIEAVPPKALCPDPPARRSPPTLRGLDFDDPADEVTR